MPLWREHALRLFEDGGGGGAEANNFVSFHMIESDLSFVFTFPLYARSIRRQSLLSVYCVILLWLNGDVDLIYLSARICCIYGNQT